MISSHFSHLQLSHYDYFLDEKKIARYPLAERTHSRLLCYDRKHDQIAHRHFYELISFLKPNDVLVFNNTQVIPARLLGRKETSGKIELLIERILGSKQILAFVKASHAPKIGHLIFIADDVIFEVIERKEELFVLELKSIHHLLKVLEMYGDIPIPGYFKRKSEKLDIQRYQTVYAKHPGAVAAPTAGLHFDENLLLKLEQAGIQMAYLTLHVGAGTFVPIRSEDIREHRMHEEFFSIDDVVIKKILEAKRKKGRIIAVGTTVARTLETIAQKGELSAQSGMTNIFIYPPYEFKLCDGLITNFHLPRSTLLMLVAAFLKDASWRSLYEEAIEKDYRFYSYGDAMFIF